MICSLNSELPSSLSPPLGRGWGWVLFYFICFRASFTTCSTGRSGCSCKMAETTLADGAGEKPSMVRAPMASSRTTRDAAPMPADVWLAAPPSPCGAKSGASLLSFKSTMMRCAVRRPMPFTLFNHARRVGTHAAHGNQLPVELALLTRGKAVERERVVAPARHKCLVHIEFHLLFALNGAERIERDVQTIAHTASFDDSQRRSKLGELTLHIFYHTNLPFYVYIHQY